MSPISTGPTLNNWRTVRRQTPRFGFLVGCAISAFCPMAQDANAQEITFTRFEIVAGSPAAAAVAPIIEKCPPYRIPTQLRQLDQPAFVGVNVIFDEEFIPYTRLAEIGHPWLQTTAMAEIDDRIYQRRSKRPNLGNVVTRIVAIYNPASALGHDEATPRLLRVVRPKWPENATGESRLVAMVLKVSAQGNVIDGTAGPGELPEFVAAARQAAMEWRFSPARHEGKPVESAVMIDVPVIRPKRYSEFSQPEIVAKVDPDFPVNLLLNTMRGSVTSRIFVKADGSVENVEILASDNPLFDAAVIDSFVKSTWRPARWNGEPVDASTNYVYTFGIQDVIGHGNDMVAVKLSGTEIEGQVARPAKAIGLVFPVYPYAMLRQGRRDTVKATLLVRADGKVVRVDIDEAAYDEFGGAVRAMAEAWQFLPATLDGMPAPSTVRVERKFTPRGTGDSPVSSKSRRLLKLLEADSPTLVDTKALDGPLRPLSRSGPVYPPALEAAGIEGYALLEYLVDGDGVVHLPRVLEATEQAFGYTAVATVARWRFHPPLQNGKPVKQAVRTKVRMRFELRTRDES